MQTFLHHVALAAPLFVLVFVGYALLRLGGWPKAMAEACRTSSSRWRLPAMLFRLMSDFSQLPPVDARLLIAFFGGCLIVFVIGRLIAWKLFALDGVSQSVFALGGVFSNNVLLGLPLAKVALGDAAVPSVALVLVFNALILWTLVTVSVEWALHGSFFGARLCQDAARRADQPDCRRHSFRHAVRFDRVAVAGVRRCAAGHGRAGRSTDGTDRSRHGPGRVRRARGLEDQRLHLSRSSCSFSRLWCGRWPWLIGLAADGNAGGGVAVVDCRGCERLPDVASSSRCLKGRWPAVWCCQPGWRR